MGVSLLAILFVAPLCRAQTINVTDDQATPIPGAGHDYMHMLVETVNPSNGSVTVRINIPVPKSRGFTLPHAYIYNSNGVTYPSSETNGAMEWFNSGGGWTSTSPSLVAQIKSDYDSNGVDQCDYWVDYMFTDPEGGRHALHVSAWNVNSYWGSPDCSQDPTAPPQYYSGGDDQYQANANPYTTSHGFVDVADADGTVYEFGEPVASGAPAPLYLIEDRNGNEVTPYSNGQDTDGRQVITSSGTNPVSLTVSGLSGSFDIYYGAASYNYNPGWEHAFSNGSCTQFQQDQGSNNVITQIILPNGQSYHFYYDSTYGLLDEIVYPTGGWVKYTWGVNPLSEGIALYNSSGNIGACGYQYGKPVITERQVSFDGSTPALTQYFTYSTDFGGNSSISWGSKSTTVTQTATGVDNLQIAYTYTPYQISGQPNDDYANYVPFFVPLEQKIVYTDTSAGQTLRTVTKTWYDQYLIKSQQTMLDNGSNSSSVSYTYDPGTHQLTQKVETDYYNGSVIATRTTNIAYQSGLQDFRGFYIEDRPASVQICAADGTGPACSGGNQVALTSYGYDQTTVSPSSGLSGHDYTNYSSSNNNRGNPTTKSVWDSTTGSSLPTVYTYDDTGQELSKTDPKTNLTGYAYSCEDSYLSEITNPDGTTESFGYDCSSGRLTSSTDQNNQTTNYSYNDSLGRLTEIDYAATPEGSGKTTYSYNDTPGSVSVTKDEALGLGTGDYITTSTMDGLGHTVQTAVTSDPVSTVYTDMSYTGDGQLYTQSNPYRGTVDPTYGVTKYAYDAIGRPTSIGYPDNSTATVSYSGDCATRTDAAGKVRKTCTDGWGRLIDVYEDPSGLDYDTQYSYNSLNDLIAVNQHGQSRSFAYNSLSEMTSATNPEWMPTGSSAPDTATYGYDNDGNLTSSTDARGITTTYSYDSMNHLIGKTYSDGEPSVTYTYGGGNCLGWAYTCHNVDRLTGMSDSAGSTAWAYDARGWVRELQRTTNGQTKEFTYAYNLAGSVATLTYPNGMTLNYAYNAAGEEASVENQQTSYYYAQPNSQDTEYAPQGALAEALVGKSASFGGMTLQEVYNDRLWPSSLAATSSAGTELNLGYSYLGNGDVAQETNNIDNGRTASYAYNSLNQVVTGSSQATSGQDCWAASYGYDTSGWGNLLDITPTNNCGTVYGISLSLNSNNPSSNQISGWSYDAAGNVLNTGAGTESYTWNAEERMATVESSVYGDNTYVYDGNGNRVEKATTGNPPQPYKLYWYGAGGEVLAESDASGNITDEYVFFDGARLARIDASGNVDYYLSDKLGSAAVVTDASGNVLDDCDFLPYGQTLCQKSSSGNDYLYTGLERDADQLDHTLHRQYSSNYGRWMSPDPGGVKVVNLDTPQTWNMYAYVADKPTTDTDPTGLDGQGYNSGGCATLRNCNDDRQSLDHPPGQDLSTGVGKHQANMLTATTQGTQVTVTAQNTNSGSDINSVPPAPGPPNWQYNQSTGSMDLKAGAVTVVHAGTGYAGHGKGLNNPASQSVSESANKANAGPLPRGQYTVGPPANSRQLGPVSMHLTPSPSNNMGGRGNFWIHGDNPHRAPLSSSEGCIVLSRPAREAVAGSGVVVLIVVP